MDGGKVLLFWIIACNLIEGIVGMEFFLCSESPSRTITCDGPDEVIDVHVARLAYSPGSGHCSVDGFIENVNTGAALTCSEELPLTRCQGQRTCSVDSRIIFDTTLCRTGTYNANLFYMHYSCYKLDKSTKLKTSSDASTVTGQTVDIISPGFPCPMPEVDEVTSVVCTIEPQRQKEFDWIQISVEYKLIEFKNSSASCVDHIYLQEEGPHSTEEVADAGVCSRVEKPTYIRNQQNSFITVGDVFVIFTHKPESKGAKFWIQVKGERNLAPVDLTASCSSFYGNPVPSQNGCGSDFQASDSASSATTTTTAARSEGGKKTNGLLYGVLGGVFGLILLAVLIIVLVLMLRRRRKGDRTNLESAHTTENVYSEETTASRIADRIRKIGNPLKAKKNNNLKNTADSGEKYAAVDKTKKKKKPKEIVAKNKENIGNGYETVDEDKLMETGIVYAAVDKNKKINKKDNPQTDTDETVMVENDGVYEPSRMAKGNVLMNKAAAKDGENPQTDIDETVMVENDGVYEPSQLAKGNGVVRNEAAKNGIKAENVYAAPDKSMKKNRRDNPLTDTDETVMVENDGVYETSGMGFR